MNELERQDEFTGIHDDTGPTDALNFKAQQVLVSTLQDPLQHAGIRQSQDVSHDMPQRMSQDAVMLNSQNAAMLNSQDAGRTVSQSESGSMMIVRASSAITSRTYRILIRARIILASLCSQASGKYAMLMVGAWLLTAIVSLFWTPVSLSFTDGHNTWQAPSLTHPLGTDGTGADILSWLMAGCVTNGIIVLATLACTMLIGAALLNVMLIRTLNVGRLAIVAVDILLSIPSVLLALIIAVPYGASIGVIVAVCSMSYGANFARVMRPVVMEMNSSQYVEQAYLYGLNPWQIWWRHVVPNLWPYAIVQLSLCAATSVLAESGLTYIGVGVPSGVPSWGRSLSTSTSMITIHPAAAIWPGLLVACVVVALNIGGDALAKAGDPLQNPLLRQALPIEVTIKTQLTDEQSVAAIVEVADIVKEPVTVQVDSMVQADSIVPADSAIQADSAVPLASDKQSCSIADDCVEER